MKEAFSPRDEDFRGFLSTGSKGKSVDIYNITGCSPSKELWSRLVLSFQLSSLSIYVYN
jgi:hypothetical protein